MGVALIVSSVTVAFLGFISLTLWKSIINGTNPRNGSFGIWTAATKKNDAAWEAGHQAASPLLRAFGYVDIALALSLIVVGLLVSNLTPALTVGILIGAYVIVVGGFIWSAAKADAAARQVNTPI